MRYVPPIIREQLLASARLPVDALSAVPFYTAYAADPLSCEAVLGFAGQCFQQGSPAAKELFDWALTLDRAHGKLSVKCAALAKRMGLLTQAYECAFRATADDSTRTDGLLILARLFVERGEIDAGLRLLELAYDCGREHEHFASEAGEVLFAAGRPREALDWLQKHGPNIPARALTLLKARCLYSNPATLEEAVCLLEHWVHEHPDDHEAYMSLTAALLRSSGNSQRCRRWCEQGLRVFPASGFLHFHHAWTLLASGAWRSGWEEYEWRWQTGDNSYDKRFRLPIPVRDWIQDGRRKGQRIFIHAEQGYGDTFMFLKFVPMLRNFFCEIIVGVYTELLAATKDLNIADDVVDLSAAWPQFDAHLAVASIPLAMRLFTTEEIVEPCKQAVRPVVRLFRPKPTDRRRIGLVWGGAPLGPQDTRAIPNDELSKFLSGDQGVTFVILQQGLRNFMVEQAALDRSTVIDCRALCTRWEQTAQILLQLDGVLTVDTGVAHLAGLLGIPTALILSWSPDWRWLDAKEMPEFESCSIWYPSVRVFRTPADSDYAVSLASGCSYLKSLSRTSPSA